MVDILYWVFGVGLLNSIINYILTVIEKESLSPLVNLSSFGLILLRVIPMISEVFGLAEGFIRLFSILSRCILSPIVSFIDYTSSFFSYYTTRLLK